MYFELNDKIQQVRHESTWNNVAVFVDNKHVCLYRLTIYSKYCAYYRCSTCDRIYQERREESGHIFKIIDGSLLGERALS
ncbi:hypothetical protein, variant [Loa loa]|uniref:RYYR-CCHC domain-containing protein n=1 Tax=Loa loa TaxID=7209 RepID=A0A1S0UG08_LOALO|nr:hypothetical protein LOAG_10848 [Loa loa]XP_020305432.1 hypothetical protein, variant [Loa loa]EFO17650.2 hypothetical protein LOAG_10848 [Loa loa]EJD74515.1 hypothetical protein, variant [Loa loa]